jgi:hypothetical protein
MLAEVSTGTELAQAMSHVREYHPLIVFGHMHKQLAYGDGLQKMTVVDANKRLYTWMGPYIVPRARRLVVEQGTDNTNSIVSMNDETSVFSPESGGTLRAFT